jgi:hypothetical protein
MTLTVPVRGMSWLTLAPCNANGTHNIDPHTADLTITFANDNATPVAP